MAADPKDAERAKKRPSRAGPPLDFIISKTDDAPQSAAVGEVGPDAFDPDATVIMPRPAPRPAAAARREPSGSRQRAMARGLRADIVAHVFDAVGRDAHAHASPLDYFLTEDAPALGLLQWFGAKRLAGGAGVDLAALTRDMDRDIAHIDALLGAQVNAILHAPRLQRLEASWRGLDYLVEQASAAARVRVRMLGVRWAELARDAERATDFDQSQLFNLVYNEEFGMPGGLPYGVLIADYEVRHVRTAEHPTDDVSVLTSLSQVAAAAFAPLIVGAAPAMLGLDDFGDLGVPFDLHDTFSAPEYARWKAFQQTEDARFVGVTLPRVLMRTPMTDGGGRVDGFRFAETANAAGLERYLWGAAGYAFAAVLIRAFDAFGWFADIRGVQRDSDRGGLVLDLPVQDFVTDRPGVAIKYSTDASISDRQEKQLSDLGFIPMSKCKDTRHSAFYSNQSAQRPKRYDSTAATTNARLSSMLQYIFCVSRFAHYIKVMGRDRVGSFTTPEACQNALSEWLRTYATGNEDADEEQKALYPLREGGVVVREAPGRPGSYLCTIHLRPHFQLDQVVSSFELVTELPAQSAA